MEPIDCVMGTGTARRSFSLAKLASLLLTAYWLLLMVGTHLPASVGGSLIVWDKLAHWAAYAGLGLLLAVVIHTRGGLSAGRYLAIFLIAVGSGAIDELAQLPIPGRCADVRDWIANVLGVTTGLIIYRLLAAPILSRFSSQYQRRCRYTRSIPETYPARRYPNAQRRRRHPPLPIDFAHDDIQ